jgi:hypothetical protein
MLRIYHYYYCDFIKEQLNSYTALDWTKRLYYVAGFRMSGVSQALWKDGAKNAKLNGVLES